MSAASTNRSPLAEEQQGFELPNKKDDYAFVPTPTGHAEEEYAPSTPERPGTQAEYSTVLSADNIKQTAVHLKHAWSWLVSAATGELRHTALSSVTTSRPAGPSSRAWRPPFMRFGAARSLSGKGARSSIVGNDGRKSNYNRLFSMSAADAMEAASSEGEDGDDEEEGRGGGEEEREEEEVEGGEVVVGAATGSGVGLWASRGMLAGAAMLYGTNFGCVKLLEETVPMSLAAVLRFTLAVVPFLPFLVNTNLGVFRAGVQIGLFDAIGFWAQSKSLTTTPASKAAFICSLSVILVPVMDAVFGARDGAESKAAKATEVADKKCQALVYATLIGPWFPALLAVAGVACLEFIGAKSGPSTGDAWAMVQPLCFSVVFWLTERSSRKYPGDTLGIVAAHLLTVAVLAIGWCAQAGQLPVSFESLKETVIPSSGSLAVPLALLWTGLVTTSLTVFAETVAMEKISAAESTIIFATEPIWGTAFAAVLLGETIGWNTGLGAMLIVLACTWSSVGPAIQSKLSPLEAAMGVVGTSAWTTRVDVDGFMESVGTSSFQEVRHSIYV